MTYVEWLRVRNVWRVVAIVLAAFILLGGMLRLSVLRMGSVDDMIRHVQMQSGTKTSATTLPDGTRQVTMDAPDGTHIVIQDHGYGGKHVVITEPMGRHSSNDHVLVGSIRVNQTTDGKRTITDVETDSTTPFVIVMGFGEFMALIVATVLAAPFARENDGHLEFALTKPIGRVAYGVRAMGVDAVGILGTTVMTIVTAIIIQAMFEVPRYDFGGLTLFAVLMGIALPLSWYAMLVAATASMRRNYGAVLGLSWPVAAVISVLSAMSLGGSIVGNVVHGVFWGLARLIPLTYASFSPAHRMMTTGNLNPGDPEFAVRFAIICALLLVYGALAVWQWRRVEA